MDARVLMELHVDALYTSDASGQLLAIREPNGGPAPRFFVGRTADATVCRFRFDVPDALRSALVAASARSGEDIVDTPPSSLDEELVHLRDILDRSAPVRTTSAGPAYAFPHVVAPLPPARGTVVQITEHNAQLLDPLLSPWTPDIRQSTPLMALVADDQAVAVCASVRITHRAHEAGVETAAAYRGRGYAQPVVTAWAQQVRALGAEPLYSTSWQNAASRALARKLGLIHFGNDLHLT